MNEDRKKQIEKFVEEFKVYQRQLFALVDQIVLAQGGSLLGTLKEIPDPEIIAERTEWQKLNVKFNKLGVPKNVLDFSRPFEGTFRELKMRLNLNEAQKGEIVAYCHRILNGFDKILNNEVGLRPKTGIIDRFSVANVNGKYVLFIDKKRKGILGDSETLPVKFLLAFKENMKLNQEQKNSAEKYKNELTDDDTASVKFLYRSVFGDTGEISAQNMYEELDMKCIKGLRQKVSGVFSFNKVSGNQNTYIKIGFM
jgi:hypothetical protein